MFCCLYPLQTFYTRAGEEKHGSHGFPVPPPAPLHDRAEATSAANREQARESETFHGFSFSLRKPVGAQRGRKRKTRVFTVPGPTVPFPYPRNDSGTVPLHSGTLLSRVISGPLQPLVPNGIYIMSYSLTVAGYNDYRGADLSTNTASLRSQNNKA